MNASPFLPTSLLFVPGSMPDRFAKAVAAGADVVCLDLEDAVAPADKGMARDAVIRFVETCARPDRLCVRINRLGSLDGLRDTVALAQAAVLPGLIMLPKVESPRDVEMFAGAFDRQPGVIGLVETPYGVEEAFRIANTPAISMLMFGSFDYAAETGSSQEWSVLLPVRSRLVAAAAAAGKGLIDSPFFDLQDVAGAAAENLSAYALGCAGKAAIHPRMVEDINHAFTPDARGIAEARHIVAAFESSGGAVARVGGKLIELPVVRRMQRLLKRLDRIKAEQDHAPTTTQ